MGKGLSSNEPNVCLGVVSYYMPLPTLEVEKELSSNMPLSCRVVGGENWLWGGVEWLVLGGSADPLGVLLVRVPTPLLSPEQRSSQLLPRL